MHTGVLEEIDVALAIGKLPSEFLEVPRQDRAYIIAHQRVKRTMEAYEAHLHSEEIKRKT